jgi:hypothetical protein
MCIAEIVSSVANTLTALAALATAWIAFAGLRTWRAEMIGRRKADLAEEVLAGFYRVQSILTYVRSQASYSGEAKDRLGRESEEVELRRTLDAYYIPVARINENSNYLSEFFALKHRFKAVFGGDASNEFNNIERVIRNVRSASDRLTMAARQHSGSTAYSDRDQKIQAEREGVIYSCGEDDPINAEVSASIAKVEAICRPAIFAQERERERGRSGVCGWPKTTTMHRTGGK